MGTVEHVRRPTSDVGQAERFGLLFGAHREPVRRFFARRVACSHDVDDLTADVFTIAWRRLETAPLDTDGVLPWLYVISRNVLRNWQRAEQSRRRATDGYIQQFAVPSEGHEPDCSSVIQAFRALSKQDQELLRLSVWEDLDVPQMSVVLGLPRRVVSVRLHRARKRLTKNTNRIRKAVTDA